MITIDTESRPWNGTTLRLQARWTVLILHTLGASVLPCIAHQALWTVGVILHTALMVRPGLVSLNSPCRASKDPKWLTPDI